MLPVMRDIKKTLDIKRMIMVADKGLNCSDNIAAITLDKNGFVFSQSIRGTKSTSALRQWVISEEGYRQQSDKDGGFDFKLKSRQDTKTVHVTGEDGKKHDVDIEVKVVAFWSSKYDARAKCERAKIIEKAKALIKKPASYVRALHYGATKYIDNITIDTKTGEIKEDTNNIPCLNLERIQEEERLDGYYCIITSETKLKDTEIIDIYRGLWRIEESFRITKSQLKTRPMFLSTPEHIEAHYLICYIALAIVRLMQFETKSAYSAAVMLDEIAQMNGIKDQDNWWKFYHRTDISDELCSMVGINLSKKNMQLSEIKKIFSQINKK
jgi:transposase